MLTQINLSRDMKTHQHFFTILDNFKATAAGGGSSLFVHYFFQFFSHHIFLHCFKTCSGFFRSRAGCDKARAVEFFFEKLASSPLNHPAAVCEKNRNLQSAFFSQSV